MNSEEKKEDCTVPPSESARLANKARSELRKTGFVKTICPKCHQRIQIIREGNRISIVCPCRYVSVHEISF